MPDIISKADAKAAGLRFFFTGIACVQGHVTDREVGSGKCHQCVRNSWEKVRRRKGAKPFQPNLKRQAALAAGISKFMGDPCPHGHVGLRWAYNCACVECCKIACLKHAKDNNYKLQKLWMRSERGRLANREYKNVRRARERDAVGKHTAKDIKDRLTAQKGRCAWCRTKLNGVFHADHINPLALGGSNEPRNIQILCPTCNFSKGSKDPIVFAQLRGRLL